MPRNFCDDVPAPTQTQEPPRPGNRHVVQVAPTIPAEFRQGNNPFNRGVIDMFRMIDREIDAHLVHSNDDVESSLDVLVLLVTALDWIALFCAALHPEQGSPRDFANYRFAHFPCIANTKSMLSRIGARDSLCLPFSAPIDYLEDTCHRYIDNSNGQRILQAQATYTSRVIDLFGDILLA